MTPFYQHLSSVPGFTGTSIDKVGLLATAGVAAAFATHGFISMARHWRDTSREHQESRREEKGDES
jgi:hypothetical protein